MKKLSLLVGGVILSTAVLAQKPTEGAPMSLEAQIGLNAGPAGGTGLQFTAPAFRFRYWVTDNIAARLTLGIDNNTRTYNVYENGDGTGATGSVEYKDSDINAAIGAEYHFTGTDRLSPYVGLDVAFGSGLRAETYAEAGAPSEGSEFYNDQYASSFEAKSGHFGVNLVAGMDFYFAENFYIGLELGLGFRSETTKEYSRTTTDTGVTTTTVTPESTDSMFGNGAVPTGNFRLGWRF